MSTSGRESDIGGNMDIIATAYDIVKTALDANAILQYTGYPGESTENGIAYMPDFDDCNYDFDTVLDGLEGGGGNTTHVSVDLGGHGRITATYLPATNGWAAPNPRNPRQHFYGETPREALTDALAAALRCPDEAEPSDFEIRHRDPVSIGCRESHDILGTAWMDGEFWRVHVYENTGRVEGAKLLFNETVEGGRYAASLRLRMCLAKFRTGLALRH